MELIIFVIGLITFVHLFYTSIEFKLGSKKIRTLSNQRVLPRDQLPSVTIILSALNEEKVLEAVIHSLLKLDYPSLEIIAINDRSTDNTFQILEKLQSQFSRLRVYHIHNLPKGWLGKTHALYFAALKASGEWLLFTDADVSMNNTSILKAVSYVLTHQIDHLTIYEHHVRKRFWLKVLMLGSYTSYSMVMKPWRIRYAWSKKYLGHGAFNLIKKDVYFQSGGHRAISMECLDDLMLGKLIKEKGFRQDIVDGAHLIEREWYESARDMINGLKKNSFAFFNFNILAVCRDFIFAFIYFIWPLIAMIIFAGSVRWINIMNVLLMLYFTQAVAKQFRLHSGFAFLYPISISMLLYTVLCSVFSTYKNNGIIWRDTHYSLAELRCKNPANMQEE